MLIRKFSNDSFRNKLLINSSVENINTTSDSIERFLHLCVNTLNHFSPEEKKCIRRNNIALFDKSLASAHKKGKHYRNLYIKKRSEENTTLYVNNEIIVFLYWGKNEKFQQILINLNHIDIAYKKKHWKTVKPLLSEKLRQAKKLLW